MTTPVAEIRSFTVTIPAGTALDAPVTSLITFPPRLVEGVHWKVPPGPSGLMGWRLTMSGGQPVLPAGGGWIIADDESAQWALTDQPDSGDWEVTGYNTDIYDHSVYLDLLLNPIPVAAPVTTLLSSASLSAPASSSALAIPAL